MQRNFIHSCMAVKCGPCTGNMSCSWTSFTHFFWSIMQICWQDRIKNQEILDKTGSVSTEAKIIKAQLPWSGQVTYMDKTRIAKQLFYEELSSGSHKQGHPKRYKENLKSYIKWANIQPKQLKSATSDRYNWWSVVRMQEPTSRRIIAISSQLHVTANTDLPQLPHPGSWVSMPFIQLHMCFGIWAAKPHADILLNAQCNVILDHERQPHTCTSATFYLVNILYFILSILIYFTLTTSKPLSCLSGSHTCRSYS